MVSLADARRVIAAAEKKAAEIAQMKAEKLREEDELKQELTRIGIRSGKIERLPDGNLRLTLSDPSIAEIPRPAGCII